MRRSHLTTLLALLLSAASLHCGGGGGGGGGGNPIPPPPGDPVFTSDGACANLAVRLQPGDVSGSRFEIDVMVTTDVANFYGAAFGIQFSGATFVGIDTTEASFLGGVSSETLADLQGPGVVEVGATITAQQAGIPPSATIPLVTLVFQATGDGDFDFLGAAEREVRVCATATSCTTLAGVCWDGGSLALI
jgi:hypothetical protein